MWIHFIPTNQNKFLKRAKYFFILVGVFGLETGTQCNVHNGLIVYYNCCRGRGSKIGQNITNTPIKYLGAIWYK